MTDTRIIVFAQMYSTNQALQDKIEICGLKSIFGRKNFEGMPLGNENVRETCQGLEIFKSRAKLEFSHAIKNKFVKKAQQDMMNKMKIELIVFFSKN